MSEPFFVHSAVDSGTPADLDALFARLHPDHLLKSKGGPELFPPDGRDLQAPGLTPGGIRDALGEDEEERATLLRAWPDIASALDRSTQTYLSPYGDVCTWRFGDRWYFAGFVSD